MTENIIKLNRKTLCSQVNERVSIRQANKLKLWLKLKEVDVIIKNALELVVREFPLSL